MDTLVLENEEMVQVLECFLDRYTDLLPSCTAIADEHIPTISDGQTEYKLKLLISKLQQTAFYFTAKNQNTIHKTFKP